MTKVTLTLTDPRPSGQGQPKTVVGQFVAHHDANRWIADHMLRYAAACRMPVHLVETSTRWEDA